MDQTERYFAAAKAAGCPADQAARFASAGYVALPKLLPYHAMCRQIDTRNGVQEIMLDGTRGSAKSHAIIAQVGLDDCQRYSKLKGLFLRQTQRAASESFDDLVSRVLSGVKHRQNSERIEFGNKSRIVIGGYKDDGDIDKYLGIEYDFLVLEEATQISGDRYERLLGSIRTSRDDWVPRKYLSTNPGGIGHAYYKDRFITPNLEHRETYTRRYQTSYKDNPFVNPEYKTYLDNLTGDLARIWRDGDWDVFEGQAIAFKRDKHVIRPCEIPAYWTRITGYDWGHAKPMAYLWGARNPDNGRVVVYRELYQAGLTDPQQAETIKAMESIGEDIRVRYADPSIWTPRTIEDIATSTADVFSDHGLYLERADNDRLNGKRKVDRMLGNLPDGLPGLLVFETCRNLIRTLPALVYDKTRVEDVDTDGEDHAYDALRYLLTDAREAKPKKVAQKSYWDAMKDI